MNSNLITNSPYSDFTLKQGSCWITVGNLSVYIQNTEEGVVIDVYPRGLENSDFDLLARTQAFYDLAQRCIDDNAEGLAAAIQEGMARPVSNKR